MLSKSARRGIISARVVGFLLLEHHVQSTIMSDAACASLVSRITSPHRNVGGNEHDVVFTVGKVYRDDLIRPDLCTFFQ